MEDDSQFIVTNIVDNTLRGHRASVTPAMSVQKGVHNPAMMMKGLKKLFACQTFVIVTMQILVQRKYVCRGDVGDVMRWLSIGGGCYR